MICVIFENTWFSRWSLLLSCQNLTVQISEIIKLHLIYLTKETEVLFISSIALSTKTNANVTICTGPNFNCDLGCCHGNSNCWKKNLFCASFWHYIAKWWLWRNTQLKRGKILLLKTWNILSIPFTFCETLSMCPDCYKLCFLKIQVHFYFSNCHKT